MRIRSRRARAWVAGLLAAAALTAIHVHVERRGLDYAGPLLLADHIFDLAAAVGLLALCAALGQLALHHVGVRLERPLEALLFSIPAGTGLFALAVLLLGAVGGLGVLPLLAVVAACALAARRELGELPGLVARGLAEARREAGSRELGWLAAIVFAAATAFLLVFALGPPADWDSLMYHLRVPAQYLEQGRIYLPEDNLRTSYVNVVHMLYLPLLAVGSQAGPAVLSACFAALLGVAVFACAARFVPGATAATSAALLWGTTTILIVGITPRTDVTLALFVFLAHYALLLAREDAAHARLFPLAAAILGLAVGVKFHALPYIVALSPLVVWAAYAPTRRPSDAVRSLAAFALVGAAAALPWLLKNWVLLRAPLYPLLSQPLLEPWLVPLFGQRTVPATVDRDALRIVWESRSAFNLADAFTAPERISIEYEGRFYYANPALLLLPLWLLFSGRRTISWLVVPAVGYLFVLLVPFPETNLRYVVAAVPALTIAVAHVLVRSAERWMSRPGAHYAVGLVTLLALVPSGLTAYVWLRSTPAVAHLSGRASALAYLQGHVLPEVGGYAAAVRAVNELAPPDARILMLFEGRGFYFEPEVLQDHNSSTWPLLADIGPPGCLGAAGITHVLVNVGAVDYYVSSGADPTVLRWDDFLAFARRCLTPVARSPVHVLFEVTGDGG